MASERDTQAAERTSTTEDSGVIIEEKGIRIRLFGSATSDIAILGAALGLAYIGVAVTYVQAHLAYLYWLVLIPIYAVVCLAIEWQRMRHMDIKWTAWLRKQLLHWGALVIAVQLMFTLLEAGRMPRSTIGLVILLLLAFATFLYGVHIDWRFIVVGVFLGLTFVLMAYLVSYIWILLLILIVMIAVGTYMFRRQGTA